eukprot:c23117_g1_i1 orf=168-884(+)
MAQEPKIELTIMAAEGLKNVNLMRGKMNPYAVAFVEPYAKHSTRVRTRGGKDPIWNDDLHIPIPARMLNDPAASLTIQVFNQGGINNGLVGATQLNLQDLFRHAALKSNGEGDILTLQLFRPSGRPHGIIRIFLKLSGDGLPGLPRLLGDDVDVGCYDSIPATGIPLMPTMGIHGVPASVATGHTSEKYSYPYRAPSYVHSAYLPYPTPPMPYPRRNNNFLFGLVSGAVAAVLLGSLF